jgi:PTS system beta-glucosides-specific IIC component
MAAVNYGTLAGDILAKVGGESNVASVVHCATRLRFTLKNSKLADKDAVASLPGVITVVENGGQFQVVIGNNVPKVYAGLPGSLTADDSGSGTVAKGNFVAKAVDIVSSIFAPILGVMAATGILKGLLIIASTTKLVSSQSTGYQLLYAAADAFFVFLPVLLAVTTARKFGANPYTAMTLAGGLLYTNLVNVSWMIEGKATPMTMLAFMKAGHPIDFFGIPVILQSYTSSVVPIILAVWVQSLLEKQLNRFIHEAVRNFITPLIALVIMLPLTLLTLGPAGTWLSAVMAGMMTAAYSLSPMLMGALMGGLWQVLVIFGIHWGIVPLFINNIATQGFDFLKSGAFPAVFGQAGATLGVMLRVKDPKTKALSASAFLAAIFGITEPAIYGITLPRKRAFVIASISGAVGGAVVGAGGVKMFSTGAPGLLTLPIGIDPSGNPANFLWLISGTAIAFVLAAIGTYMFGFTADDKAKDAASALTASTHQAQEHAAVNAAAPTAEIDLLSPMTGAVIPLSEVKDKVFSSGAMGQGFGILPDAGEVLAPIGGRVDVSMGHAFGITSPDGVEILVHVGIDTVKLNGAPFSQVVAEGAQVQAGDLLAVADLEAIEAAGLDTTTVAIITNSTAFAKVNVVATGEVAAGDVAVMAQRDQS